MYEDIRNNKIKTGLIVSLFIVVIALISIVFILTHLFFFNCDDFIKYANMCDQDKGSICSYYEVRNYMLRGGK